jgi:hypothetical protein
MVLRLGVERPAPFKPGLGWRDGNGNPHPSLPARPLGVRHRSGDQAACEAFWPVRRPGPCLTHDDYRTTLTVRPIGVDHQWKKDSTQEVANISTSACSAL